MRPPKISIYNASSWGDPYGRSSLRPLLRFTDWKAFGDCALAADPISTSSMSCTRVCTLHFTPSLLFPPCSQSAQPRAYLRQHPHSCITLSLFLGALQPRKQRQVHSLLILKSRKAQACSRLQLQPEKRCAQGRTGYTMRPPPNLEDVPKVLDGALIVTPAATPESYLSNGWNMPGRPCCLLLYSHTPTPAGGAESFQSGCVLF